MRPLHLEMVWADGERRFALRIGELRELQDKTGVGPYALYRRLASGDWRVDDAAETLRLGLIGGGMAPTDAYLLVKRYVHERPLGESTIPALSLLAWAIMPDAAAGDEEPEAGGDKKKATPETETTPDGSTSAPFTETAL